MPEPSVSVILPAWCSDAVLPACLESLRRQTFRDFEVIVIDSSPEDRLAGIARRFSEVGFHRSERRLWPHAARNLGATLARGSILVFSDPDCRMSPRWLELLVREQRAGRPLVGGAVANLGGGWFSDGVHLCKYAWWLPGGRSGRRPELPSANVSYSRFLFERVGPFPTAWCGDTVLSRRALHAGATPWFEPSACIAHDHRATWRSFLRERFERGYDYGLARPRLERWSRARTLAYCVAAPLAVLLVTARSLKYAAASCRLAFMLWHLPIVLAGYSARQAGEACAHWRAAWLGC